MDAGTTSLRVTDNAKIRRSEEISNNAWPAVENILYDGWILRFAAGVTRRSNSVSMLYPSTIDPDEKIRFCESVFHEKRVPACFKVTSAADPGNIDGILERWGYTVNAVISFQVRDNASRIPCPTAPVSFTSPNDPSWIDEFIRMNGFDPGRKGIYSKIMALMPARKCLARIRAGDTTVAVGLGVLEDRYLGIFDIVTDPLFRGRGFGRDITRSLMIWGQQHGAALSYLQVLDNNQPALGLYSSLGFSEQYRYWYRMKE